MRLIAAINSRKSPGGRLAVGFTAVLARNASRRSASAITAFVLATIASIRRLRSAISALSRASVFQKSSLELGDQISHGRQISDGQSLADMPNGLAKKGVVIRDDVHFISFVV